MKVARSEVEIAVTLHCHNADTILTFKKYEGRTVWSHLARHIRRINVAETNAHGEIVWNQNEPKIRRADRKALSSLLKAMVLLDDAPPDMLASLQPKHARIVAQVHFVHCLYTVCTLFVLCLHTVCTPLVPKHARIVAQVCCLLSAI
jgi:hypothetical protein